MVDNIRAKNPVLLADNDNDEPETVSFEPIDNGNEKKRVKKSIKKSNK